MDPTSIGSIIISLIAAMAAVASQRAASKASTVNTVTVASVENEKNRLEMEKEAYDRARSYDTETIRRQDKEIEELRHDNASLQVEIRMLRKRIARLERNIPADSSEEIDERESDNHPVSE